MWTTACILCPLESYVHRAACKEWCIIQLTYANECQWKSIYIVLVSTICTLYTTVDFLYSVYGRYLFTNIALICNLNLPTSWTKELFVSPANSSLVGIFITIGDITSILLLLLLVVWVWELAATGVTVLCSWAKYFTLTVPLYTQE